MFERFSKVIDRIFPFLTPTSVLLGIAFAVYLAPLAAFVPWIFAMMTFSGSLQSNVSDLKHVMRHPKPLLVCFFIIQIVMPILAFSVGHTFFYGDTYTITGIILAFIIPTGISSVIWVTIYRGNIALTLSIILLNTIVSPILIPYSLKLFVGTTVSVDTFRMMVGLFWMIVVPSCLGMLINQYTKGNVTKTLVPKLAPFSKIGLGVVVAINSAAVAPFLKEMSWKLVGIISTVLLLAFSAYIIGAVVAHYVFRFKNEDIVVLTFNSGMRNISAGAVIAIAYFPPPVSIPVISCMLIQQLSAAFFGQLMNRLLNKKKKRLIESR